MAPKKKSEKMALGDFLTNQSLGSWADEMDSQPIPAVPSGYGSGSAGGERRAFSSQNSWGADRASRGAGGMGDRGASYDRPRFSDREQLPLPTKPPYTAHLGNLAFDVTQADIESFLNGCEVTSIRIVEDKMDHKPKGFGYVEFASLDGLKKALSLTDTQFMGRPIRVSVAEPPKDRGDTRDFSDWSRKGPLPELPSQGRQMSRGFSQRGGFDNASDAGSERGAGNRRQAFFQDDNKVRDLGNWERKGPLSPVPNQGPPVRDGGRLREGPPGERRQSPAWGEGRTDSGSRPPRKEFQERPQAERTPTAAEQDTQWRARMRPDASPAATPEASTPSSPQPQAPKERPKLNLAKRTVSTVDQPANATSDDSKASPFGAARPIDTATREREIDEKRQIALRQKKEADDKAKEEKAAAAKARAAAGAEGSEKTTSPSDEKPRKGSKAQNGPKTAAKENGESAAAQRERPSFSILQREDGDAEQGERDVPDASANGNITGDKETKPQEIVQEVSKGDAANAETTNEALEEDGWSTVPGKQAKKGRGTTARALAS